MNDKEKLLYDRTLLYRRKEIEGISKDCVAPFMLVRRYTRETLHYFNMEYTEEELDNVSLAIIDNVVGLENL